MATVPNVIGLDYISAQLAILDAGMLIQPPTFVVTSSLIQTADQATPTADSSTPTADAGGVPAVLPTYVTNQSLTAGTVVGAQVPLGITVSGYVSVQQGGTQVAHA